MFKPNQIVTTTDDTHKRVVYQIGKRVYLEWYGNFGLECENVDESKCTHYAYSLTTEWLDAKNSWTEKNKKYHADNPKKRIGPIGKHIH